VTKTQITFENKLIKRVALSNSDNELENEGNYIMRRFIARAVNLVEARRL
jgi:hypothetical protein